MPKQHSPWFAAYFCSECSGEVSFYDAGHNHGICPLCGAKTDSTFMKTFTRSWRWVYPSLVWWNPMTWFHREREWG